MRIKFRLLNTYRFYKKACVTCQTCLGWFTNGSIHHKSLFRFSSKKVSSPKDYFDEIIQNELDNKLKEEADYRLAKEICGV